MLYNSLFLLLRQQYEFPFGIKCRNFQFSISVLYLCNNFRGNQTFRGKSCYQNQYISLAEILFNDSQTHTHPDTVTYKHTDRQTKKNKTNKVWNCKLTFACLPNMLHLQNHPERERTFSCCISSSYGSLSKCPGCLLRIPTVEYLNPPCSDNSFIVTWK